MMIMPMSMLVIGALELFELLSILDLQTLIIIAPFITEWTLWLDTDMTILRGRKILSTLEDRVCFGVSVHEELSKSTWKSVFSIIHGMMNGSWDSIDLMIDIMSGVSSWLVMLLHLRAVIPHFIFSWKLYTLLCICFRRQSDFSVN